ncbi:MAG: hypothetical protein IKV82_08970 [Akkermansia sp.]|nr:hypothetical protein [Akkermansia sp.]
MLPYQTIGKKEEGIAIVGIGGAGANILQCFGSSSADNVRLCTMSLDERVGRACGNVHFLQLGSGMNRGLGSGGDPEVGRMAAQESAEAIREFLKGTRLLVLVAGLGGGTGSGAAPVLADMAREAGMFLVSVVLMPFAFEGHRRREQADRALEEVARLSDIVYCFENDYMEELFHSRSGARAVFEEVDRLLAKAAASVPMLASSPGLINLGLDELATALHNNDSRCLFGSGHGYGPNRAEDAARAAVESPLVSYHGAIRFARTVIVHVAGGDSMSLTEIRKAVETVREALADEEVDIFFGTTVKPHLGDEIRVTLIASIDAAEFREYLLNPPEPARAELPEEEEAPAVVAEEPAEDEVEDADVLYEEEPEMVPPAPYTAPQAEERFEPEPTFSPQPSFESPEPAFEPAAPAEEASFVPRPEPPVWQSALPLGGGNAPLRQGELMPRHAPAQEQHDGLSRVRSMFPEDGNTPEAPGIYSPEAARRRQNANAAQDDLDTPPSLRFNDLRDMFPDN